MSTLYPSGYVRAMVDIDELFRRHRVDLMHPEYARRLRAWLIAQNGRIGIGGSWRSKQPAKAGVAPEGMSFHQSQTFASGRVAFCAVDLVVVNPGGNHRSPLWSEVLKQGSPATRTWGLHCNVSGEPWHMQPIEIDGYQSWVRAGRKEPVAGYPIPVPSGMDAVAAGIAAAKRTVIRLGANEDAVVWLQVALNRHQPADAKFPQNKLFDQRVHDAVVAFQRSRNLAPDGIVGPRTWAALWP